MFRKKYLLRQSLNCPRHYHLQCMDFKTSETSVQCLISTIKVIFISSFSKCICQKILCIQVYLKNTVFLDDDDEGDDADVAADDDDTVLDFFLLSLQTGALSSLLLTGYKSPAYISEEKN